MATAAAAEKRILLISLNFQSYFDDTYTAFLDELANRAQIQRVKKVNPALRILTTQPPPDAVICTDEAVASTKFANVYDALLKYVREGGTCVFMGHFPTMIRPDDADAFFAKAGLPWKYSAYHRTTLVVNPEATQGVNGKLPSSYSQKAVYVKPVAAADAWYVTNEDSKTESLVLGSEKVHKVGETSVAFTKIGAGKLGFVGDVNGEVGSDAVVLAMCGL